MKISNLLLSTVTLLVSTATIVVGQNDGDVICVEGYIMDKFCIDRGTLLDNPSVRTLEEPEKHSVHCLVDVGICYNTPFHVLEDGSPYGTGWQVDDNSALMALARSVGDCSTCDGDGDLRAGFRAVVRGEVTDASGKVLSVQEVGLPGDELCVAACPADVMQCGDEFLVRDPDNDCEFPPCVCPLDVQECPDGSSVGRVPPECDFEPCPPTASPTTPPTPSPTVGETPQPTVSPSVSPTDTPTSEPTLGETTTEPTNQDTNEPSTAPSEAPSLADTDAPSFAPSSRPSMTPSVSPSTTPSASPSVMPSSIMASASPSMMPSASPSMDESSEEVEELVISCSEYPMPMEVPGLEGVTLEYIVNMNPIIGSTTDPNMTMDDIELYMMYNNMTDDNTTIFGPPVLSVRLTYEGEGWLGFAVSSDGKMVGSSAVIGVPNATGTGEGEAAHYNLTFDNGQGYELFPNQTTLMDDASITQNENYTILEFTRYLDEEDVLDGLPINGSGFNYFLVAHGTDNTLAYHHSGRSSFNLTLTPCNLYEFDYSHSDTNMSAPVLEEVAQVVPADDTMTEGGDDENDVVEVVNRDGDASSSANTDAGNTNNDGQGTLRSTSGSVGSSTMSARFGIIVLAGFALAECSGIF